jgi:predicted TIM-barrel enzyme
MKESAETERTRMELGVKREDTLTNAHVKINETHVKAVTAHDVAEIGAAATLIDTGQQAAHEKELAKITAAAAEKAAKRDI